jgi:hypothetical protein
VIERSLTVVAEGRVTEVVGEAGRLHEVWVGTEGLRHLATDLRTLEGVRQPSPREVVLEGHVDLGLGGKPTKRRRMQHARTVALKRGTPYALVRLGEPAIEIVALRLPPFAIHGSDLSRTLRPQA